MLPMQDVGGSSMGGDSAELVAGQEDLVTAFIASRHEKGIKRVGIIYSPRKSWCGLASPSRIFTAAAVLLCAAHITFSLRAV